jgi:UDP-N-acetylglucosamine--N-acetylmuramyl-(pentapeptide) pyrophosphoryl-undecaprenol N-acetylglucosamine transferase
VVIAGGGTGGHLFPGLALADELGTRGWPAAFVGTASGLEAREVPAAGYPFAAVPGRQVRGGGLMRAAAGVPALVRGVIDAGGLLGRWKPRLVVGVGGYASVAVVLAAKLRRLPTVLLEQNTIPGAANRVLGRLATRVCLGFAEAAVFFPRGRGLHTGNPVRREVLRARDRACHRRPGVLVAGGSQGAHRLNQAMVEAMGRLGGKGSFDLTHLTGDADHAAIRAAYERLGVGARVEAFRRDMGAAYGEADLVVSRAGAMSCAELTAVGLPSILVPYPYAADDHQRHNAEALVRAGAASMVLDRDLDGASLAQILLDLLADRARLTAMAAAARAFGLPDAASRVADACSTLVSS